MNIAFLIGRIIFGGYWLMASFNHFKNLNYMSEYAKAKGTPSPKLAVAGTGVILLVGGLSMLLQIPSHADQDSDVMSIRIPTSCRSRFRGYADQGSELMPIRKMIGPVMV